MTTTGLASLVKQALADGRFVFTGHARERLNDRSVTSSEVYQVLESGHHVPKLDKYEDLYQAWKYSWIGKTDDGRRLRLHVAVMKPNVLVLTVIDLERNS
jgi:hypothetical protein